MARKIILLIFIAITTVNTYSQDTLRTEIIGDNRPYTEIFDDTFRNVNYDTLSTKILYSRVIPFADLEKQNGVTNDTIDKSDFIQAYSELHRASNSDLKVFTIDVEELRNNIFFNSNDSLVQIGIIYSDYSIIDTNVFNDNRLPSCGISYSRTILL